MRFLPFFPRQRLEKRLGARWGKVDQESSCSGGGIPETVDLARGDQNATSLAHHHRFLAQSHRQHTLCQIERLGGLLVKMQRDFGKIGWNRDLQESKTPI